MRFLMVIFGMLVAGICFTQESVPKTAPTSAQETSQKTELFSANILVSRPEPILSDWDDLTDGWASGAEWPERRAKLMRDYLALMADEAKPPKPPLDLRWEESVDVDGAYRRYRISYAVEADERATAFLGIPSDAIFDPFAHNTETPHGTKLFPAVVALHGTTAFGMSQTAGLVGDPTKAHLDHLCRRGFVVIAPEHFVAETRIPSEGAFDTTAFAAKHPNWTAVGKFNNEHAIAIDVLEMIPVVNAQRIGVMGHSLGGQGAFFLAAYDERIAAVVANGAMGPFRQSTVAEEWARDRWYVYFRTMREPLGQGKLPNIDHHSIMVLIAPRPFLDCSALNDGDRTMTRQRVLMLMKVMDVYERLGAAENFSFYVHGRGHSIQTDVRTLIYGWLEERLNAGE